MPISTTISDTQGRRLTLSHYGPDERCRPHRHGLAQTSLLIAGDYVEDSDAGTRTVEWTGLTFKAAGFEHENTFGQAGALVLTLHTCQEFDDGPISPDIAPLARALIDHRRMSADPSGSPLQAFRPREADARDAIAPLILKDARSRLMANPDSSIAAVARSIGLHPVYFARVFRRAFGRTPGQCRRDSRTARAIQRIVRTSLPFAEIADTEGFADQAHMTRVVGEASGWSPGALRRLLS